MLGTFRGCPQRGGGTVATSSLHLRTPPGAPRPLQASATSAPPRSLSARCAAPAPLGSTQRRQAPPAPPAGRGGDANLQRAGRRQRRAPFGDNLGDIAGDKDELGDVPDSAGSPNSRPQRHRFLSLAAAPVTPFVTTGGRQDALRELPGLIDGARYPLISCLMNERLIN